MIIERENLIFLGILLCILSAVLHWVKMRMGFFKGKRSREECVAAAKKRHRFEYYLYRAIANFLLPSLIAVSLCCAGAYARINPKVDDYTYLRSGLGKQRDMEDIFGEETVDTTKQEEQEDRINKLHIPEWFIGRAIDTDMYNWFREDLLLVYVNGTKAGYDGAAPVIESDNAPYDYLDNASIREAKQYRTDYNNCPNQGSLYQYGRALSEFEPKGSNFPFEVTYSVMSESLYSLESFLEYADRDVESKNGPYVIDAYWVALLEGKMFLRNSKLAVKSEEGAGFSDCFLLEALVSFEIGLGQIDPSNEYYALLSYYVGNSGENVLRKIDKDADPGLYSSVGSKAMRGYQDAEKYYEANPSFYWTEPGIMNNITDGIQTLTTLGIPKK